jgi:hypothetical protein
MTAASARDARKQPASIMSLIEYEPRQGPARSEQITCANCLKPTEKVGPLKRRFFAESGWVRRLGF